jgi:hypothetical protein
MPPFFFGLPAAFSRAYLLPYLRQMLFATRLFLLLYQISTVNALISGIIYLYEKKAL